MNWQVVHCRLLPEGISCRSLITCCLTVAVIGADVVPAYLPVVVKRKTNQILATTLQSNQDSETKVREEASAHVGNWRHAVELARREGFDEVLAAVRSVEVIAVRAVIGKVEIPLPAIRCKVCSAEQVRTKEPSEIESAHCHYQR